MGYFYTKRRTPLFFQFLQNHLVGRENSVASSKVKVRINTDSTLESIFTHSQSADLKEIIFLINATTIQQVLDTYFNLAPVYAHTYNFYEKPSIYYSRRYILETSFLYALKTSSEFPLYESSYSSKTFLLEEKDILLDILHAILSEEERKGANGVVLFFLGNSSSKIIPLLSSIIEEDKNIGTKVSMVCSKYNFSDTLLLKKFYNSIQLESALKKYSLLTSKITDYKTNLQENLNSSFENLFLKDNCRIITYKKINRQINSLSELVSSSIRFRKEDMPSYLGNWYKKTDNMQFKLSKFYKKNDMIELNELIELIQKLSTQEKRVLLEKLKKEFDEDLTEGL